MGILLEVGTDINEDPLFLASKKYWKGEPIKALFEGQIHSSGNSRRHRWQFDDNLISGFRAGNF